MLPLILRKKYYTKCYLKHKTQVNATCDLSGPARSPHVFFRKIESS